MKKLGRRDFIRRTVASSSVVSLGGASFFLKGCKTVGGTNLSARNEAITPSETSSFAAAAAPAGGTRKTRGSIFDTTNPNAVKYVQAFSALQKSGAWAQLAGVHGSFCPHNNWFFLPWHRAYLSFFEEACADALKDPTFALPYWDWEAPGHDTIPAPVAPSPIGALNWPTRDKKPGDQMDSRQIGKDAVQRIINLNNFVSFGSFPSSKPRGGLERAGSGDLESIPHNSTHGWVGGDMGLVPRSANDPIFWLHHCNLDRMWASWEMNQKSLGLSPLPPDVSTTVNPRAIPLKVWLDTQVGDYVTLRNGKIVDKLRVTVRDLVDYEKQVTYRYQTLFGTAAPNTAAIVSRSASASGFAPSASAAARNESASNPNEMQLAPSTPSANMIQLVAFKALHFSTANLDFRAFPMVNERAVVFALKVGPAGTPAAATGVASSRDPSSSSADTIVDRFSKRLGSRAASALQRSVTSANSLPKPPMFILYVDNVPIPKEPSKTLLHYFLNLDISGGLPSSMPSVTSPNYLTTHSFFGEDHNHSGTSTTAPTTKSIVVDLTAPMLAQLSQNKKSITTVTMYVEYLNDKSNPKRSSQDLPDDLKMRLAAMQMRIEYTET